PQAMRFQPDLLYSRRRRLVSRGGTMRATPMWLALALIGALQGKTGPADWPMFGRDLAGTHYSPDEAALRPSTVSRLRPKWVFETEGDVSAQPTVVGGVVYFGSWDGKQYAVDGRTGKKLWAYDCGSPSRAAAAYDEGVVYFGDLSGRLYAADAA